jgi:hypothetical protein
MVQLPVPDPDFYLARANIPLAAACLKGAAAGLPFEIEILPADIADRGGDARILKWIGEGDFDTVCFTLYLWNRERSAWLAARLRETQPRSRLVAGGPEVQEDNAADDLAVFDHLIPGEGESAFLDILGHGDRFQSLFSHPLAPAGDQACRHPYLSGALPMGPDRPVHLETMRGCPFRCAYCYYGKNSGPLRYAAAALTEAAFALAGARGVKDLYLMDPSLSARPDFTGFLRSIGEWNDGRLAVHAEIPLESVTEEVADLMARAGIKSAEAGLQSSNPAALEAVGRYHDRKKFESGARLLQGRGIEVHVGLILGLPHDGLARIEESLEYVASLGLSEKAGAFPLAVLPGTELRRRAADYSMDYMAAPPYYLLSNAWLSAEEMREAARSPEAIWGSDIQEPVRPHFFRGDPSQLQFIDLRSDGGVEALLRPDYLASSLTLLLGPMDQARKSALLAAAKALASSAPFTQYQLVWTAAADALPDIAEMELFGGAFSVPGSYADRARYFDEPGTPSGARRFFLSDSAVQALRWAEDSRRAPCAELILDLRRDPDMAELAAEYDWEILPFILAENQKALSAEAREAYAGFENLLIFAEEASS